MRGAPVFLRRKSGANCYFHKTSPRPFSLRGQRPQASLAAREQRQRKRWTPRPEPPGAGASGGGQRRTVGRGLGPRPWRHRVTSQRRFPGRASVARRPHRSPSLPWRSSRPWRSSPHSLPGQSQAKARGAAVSGRESPGKRRGPGGSRPSAGGPCASDPPTVAPPPGAPELADGRHGSRARAEGCGAAGSRTPAPAAEVTAAQGNGLGAPEWVAGAGWRSRGWGEVGGAGKA